MHTISKFFSCAVMSVFATDRLAEEDYRFAFSPLAGKSCVTQVDDRATGARTTECPGVHGYRLHIIEDDERVTVNVIAPDRRSFALDYWGVITRGFSTLGRRAEWVIHTDGGRSIPVAVIVRVDTLDQRDPEHPQARPLLAVAKIRRDTACVTHRIDASKPGAAALAREAASESAAPCLHEIAATTPEKG
ncbi:hypothetical protein E7V67_018815 [[Empedobacter] haloabium]|uniref:Uncharacterized protein n=1 Tax=[Empedobacter] haloabium TaxID=592317 RepID=A0ABZ1UGA1_9BURK